MTNVMLATGIRILVFIGAIWIMAAKAQTADWLLTDGRGSVFESSQLHGYYGLIYFGYLTCPDICPIELNTIGAAMRALHDVPTKGIFISLDPARDTPEDIRKYVDFFHPGIVGLTGSDEEIRLVADYYKIRFNKSGDGEGYLIDHSIHIVVTDPTGAIQALTPFGVTADHLEKLVRDLAVSHTYSQ